MIIVIMGVSGVGKSTIGQSLAERLGFEFAEGDEYHPQENVAKMRSGIALDDTDRMPWLQTMAAEIQNWNLTGRNVILACSALKRHYRRVLIGEQHVTLIYLRGRKETIAARMHERQGHYMPPTLLDSQFAALEEPGESETEFVVEVTPEPASIVDTLYKRLQQYNEKNLL